MVSSQVVTGVTFSLNIISMLLLCKLPYDGHHIYGILLIHCSPYNIWCSQAQIQSECGFLYGYRASPTVKVGHIDVKLQHESNF